MTDLNMHMYERAKSQDRFSTGVCQMSLHDTKICLKSMAPHAISLGSEPSSTFPARNDKERADAAIAAAGRAAAGTEELRAAPSCY